MLGKPRKRQWALPDFRCPSWRMRSQTDLKNRVPSAGDHVGLVFLIPAG
jgi:hypothetical protein